jgi:hypothetical protein
MEVAAPLYPDRAAAARLTGCYRGGE